MYIVYYFNQPIAAKATLEAANRIRERQPLQQYVKIVFEK